MFLPQSRPFRLLMMASVNPITRGIEDKEVGIDSEQHPSVCVHQDFLNLGPTIF